MLPSEVVNRARQKGYALLFARRILFRPIQTFKLLRTLGRHMKFADILRLLSSPFRRRKLNRTPELPAKMIERGLTAPIRTAAPMEALLKPNVRVRKAIGVAFASFQNRQESPDSPPGS